ncbi:MAG: signal peptide peptidase SppA [bacterium]|nr:signal peptide peptidase SppA [bacterium]
MRAFNFAVFLFITTAIAFAYTPYGYWTPPTTGAAGSIAVADDARSVPLNPAALSEYHGFNLYFAHYAQRNKGANDWNLYLDTPIGGLGYDSSNIAITDPQTGNDYDIKSSRFSYGLGMAPLNWIGTGFGVDYYAASKPYYTTAVGINCGTIIRPFRYLSVGITARDLNEPRFLREVRGRNYGLGIGIRPGLEMLTLAGDVYWYEDDTEFDDLGYKVGLDFEPVKGVTLHGDYRNSTVADSPEEMIGVGLTLDFVYGNVGYDAKINRDGDFLSDSVSVGIRTQYRKSVLDFSSNYAEITIAGKITEEESGWSILGGNSYSGRDIIEVLKKAENDDDVEGVMLKVKAIDPGFSPGIGGLIEEIREQIEAVQANGKPVYCFLESADNTAAYYLASACNAIMMPRWGHFAGLGTEMAMWRITKLSESFGVEWDFITAGENKGTFHSIGPAPGESDFEIVQNLVDDTYDVFIRDVCRDRGFDREELNGIINGAPMYAEEAARLNLIDEVGRYEDFKEYVSRQEGKNDDNGPPTIDLSHREYWDDTWGEPKSIRIIMATGGINVGESGHSIITGSNSMGADTIVRRIKEAREDPNVGAVVLRVDSGGGDAYASEDIYEELIKTREKKPVVASMGSVAASGGYMISLGAGRIFADETTITGSIGVVWAKPVLDKLYEKYGLDRYPVKSGEHTDATSVHRRFTEEEKAWAEKMVMEGYAIFKGHVSRERGIDMDALDEMAQGKIYSGIAAKRLNLIDELGGLEEAIEYIRDNAGLPDDAPIEYVGREFSIWDTVGSGAATALGLGDGLF